MELWEYLNTRKETYTEIAKRLGIGRDHLSRIIHYKTVPSPELAMRIQELTYGRVSWWKLIENCIDNRSKE